MDNSVVIKSMVDDILSDRSSDALDKFNELMKFKMADAIDDKKNGIAKTIYNVDQEEVSEMAHTSVKNSKKQASADRKEQNKEKAKNAFQNMFGGENVAAKLGIRKTKI